VQKNNKFIGLTLALVFIVQFFMIFGLAAQDLNCELTLYQYYGNSAPIVAYGGTPLEVHALENSTIINQTMTVESVKYGNLKREISKSAPYYDYDLIYNINNPEWNNTAILYSFQVPGDCYLMEYGFELNYTNSLGFIITNIYKSRFDEESQQIIPIIEQSNERLYRADYYGTNTFPNFTCNVLLDYETTFNGTYFLYIAEAASRQIKLNVQYDNERGDNSDDSITYDFYGLEYEIDEDPYWIYIEGQRLAVRDGNTIDPHFFFKVDTPSHTGYQTGSIDILDVSVNGSALSISGYYSTTVPKSIVGNTVNWNFASNWDNFTVHLSQLFMNYSKTWNMEIDTIDSFGTTIGFDFKYVLTVDPLLYGAQLQFKIPKTVTNPQVTRDGGAIPITYKQDPDNHLIYVFGMFAQGGYYNVNVDFPSGITQMQITQTLIVVGIIAACGGAAGSIIFIVKRKQTERLLQKYT
jgi:hypothetical protein